ncbi:MAG: replicative DNA helicase [Lachnospiraceae bacterium]|nr:replicative DNA helicase [Lachnospiraceae bacterium]
MDTSVERAGSALRVPPHAAEAERSVIGAMFLSKDAIMTASEMLTSKDFYDGRYGLIFDVINELFNSQKPIDDVTIVSALKEKNAPDEVCNINFLADIIDSVPTSANVGYYANIVRERALRRQIIKVCSDIENDCYSGTAQTEDLINETEKRIFDLVQNRGHGTFAPIQEIVINVLKRIQEVSKSETHITGVPSGFDRLDEMTAGFQPSDLILIAARPSMGKTAFVLNIAQYACFRKNKHVLIFSLEMSKEQLVNRLLAMDSHVDSTKLRDGKLNDDEWNGLLESGGTVGRSNLVLDETPGITVSELRSKCRRMKVEQGLDMVIIDYLQLMSGTRSGRSEQSRQQEISDISRSLKALARELRVPVIALSQLSRAPEQRQDHRPQLSDLRESGAIEQDADMVMFIYRDDYYNEDSDRKGIADIIIAKHRNGEVGKVSLVWLASLTKFENMIPDQTEER